MSLKVKLTTLIVASLLATAAFAPAVSAGEPANRLECKTMDPSNLTDFCRDLFELDAWRLQIMDETGPTPPKHVPVPLGPALPAEEWAVA